MLLSSTKLIVLTPRDLSNGGQLPANSHIYTVPLLFQVSASIRDQYLVPCGFPQGRELHPWIWWGLEGAQVGSSAR